MSIVTGTDELAAICKRFAHFDFVTVDTEFMRETTYWPKLCVVQMASPEEAFIIDALAPDLDLAPFFKLMKNEKVVKVFHAARQDIEIAYHLGGLIPHPVFDTQVAAMVCGFGDSISYDQLVERTSGARIDKSSRFTDWSRRPLSQKQIDYALADVTHLREVYLALSARLDEQNRSEWVREEMEVLTSVDTYRLEPEAGLEAPQASRQETGGTGHTARACRLAGARGPVPRRAARPRAQGRCDLRDRAAAADHAGGAVAAPHRPEGLRALTGGRGDPRGGQEGLSLPKDQMPKLPKHRSTSNGNGAAVDLLKVLLKMISENHGVAAKVIATVDDLEAIAADDRRRRTRSARLAARAVR